MKNASRWLQAEIPAWVSDGLIDQHQADAIRQRYPDLSSFSWGRFLLSAMGAIIFGLGIILFFAYNWADMPKYVKLAVIIGSLIVAHLSAFALSFKSAEFQNLSEGLHVLGTMLFGAGIWLIAQIYHLDEHYPNAFLAWGLCATAMAWVLPSVIQGLLAVILLSVWGTAEVVEFDSLHLASPGLLLMGLVTLAWQQRSRVLLFFSVLATLALVCVNVTWFETTVIFYVIFSMATLLIAVATLVPHTSFPQSADVLVVLGSLVYGSQLFVLSFIVYFLHDWLALPNSTAQAVSWGTLALAGLTWILILARLWRTATTETRWLHQALILIATLLIFSVSIGVFHGPPTILTLLFSGILTAHAVLLIIHGTEDVAWQRVLLGCALLALIVLIRFNDLFTSLLMRSLVFVMLGAGLFFIGHWYSRAKERQRASHA